MSGLEASGLTVSGPFRRENEDVVLADSRLGLYAVIDGVGGRPLGERAAALCAELLSTLCRGRPSAEALRDVYFRINEALCAESRVRGLLQPMAAVATVAWLDGQCRGVVGHIGDTRALLFDRQGAGCQLTRDQAAINADLVPEAQTLAAPGRNVVASALGLAPWSRRALVEQVEIRELALEPGHTLILVSDGISDYLDRARLAAVVADSNRSAEALASALVAAAIDGQSAAGAGDNLGAVVVRRTAEAAPLERGAQPTRRTLAAVAAGMTLGLFAAGGIAGAHRAEPAQELVLSAPSEGLSISLEPGAHIRVIDRRGGAERVRVRVVVARQAEIELCTEDDASAGGQP